MFTYFSVFLTSALTLAIFSRIFRPNQAFRWASHLLLGLGAGYTAAIVLKQVLLPTFSLNELTQPVHLVLILTATALSALLTLRFAAKPEIRAWGLLPLGLISGVGGALALAGAMRGSLLPQLMATSQINFSERHFVLNALGIAVATLTSLGVLLYLLPGLDEHRSTDESKKWIAWLLYGWRLWGYWILMLALGALLASTAGARITLLIERVQYLMRVWF